jgi:hypothetical protein
MKRGFYESGYQVFLLVGKKVRLVKTPRGENGVMV